MYTVAIQRFPDVRWLHGDSRMYTVTVATQKYTAPTRSDADHFSLRRFNFFPGPVGAPRITPDAFPVSTRMMPEITRSSRIKIRDAINECVKAP